MRRREFLGVVRVAAAAWPLAARAQQPDLPLIGFLIAVSPEAVPRPSARFRRGLRTRLFEGREYRDRVWLGRECGRFPELAADFVRRKVDVLVASGSPYGAGGQAGDGTIPSSSGFAEDPSSSVLSRTCAAGRQPHRYELFGWGLCRASEWSF